MSHDDVQCDNHHSLIFVTEPKVSTNVWINTPVTVTEALVLCPLLEDRGRIIRVRVLVPGDRMKQKCFQITTKRVDHSSFISVDSLFHEMNENAMTLSAFENRLRSGLV